MQKNVLRFFSSLLAVVILSSVVIPASADFGGGTGRSDFFTWTDGFGGGSFGGGAGREQSKSAYDNYVETLPAQGYMSSGGFIWYPTVSDISHLWPDLINNAFDKDTLDSSSRSFSISLRTERLNGQQQFYYSVPFNGTYKLHDSLVLGYRYLSDDGIVSGVMPPRGDTKSVYKSSGQTVADQAIYPGYNPYFPSKDSLVVYSYRNIFNARLLLSAVISTV